MSYDKKAVLRRMTLVVAVSLLSAVGCGGPSDEVGPGDPGDAVETEATGVVSSAAVEGNGQVTFHLDANTYRRVPLSGSIYSNHWWAGCTNTGKEFYFNVYKGDGTYVATRTDYYAAEWWGGSNNHYIVIHSGSSGRNCTVTWQVN